MSLTAEPVQPPDAPPPAPGTRAAANKTQADLLAERRRSKERRFKTGVWISYAVLLGFLVFLFSGVQFTIFGVTFQTISLDWDFIETYAPFIFAGVWLTILLSVLSIALSVVLAVLGALGRLSRSPAAYALASFYVSLIRGTPLLLQLFFFFLALPQLGITLTGLWAGVLALGINYGAYNTEIVRAGIQSVGVGQREAAMALGMTGSQITRRIVLPQALRLVIPPLGNQFIAMLKDTSLVATTGFVWEILWRAQKVGRANFRSLEALLVAAVFYWIITIIFSLIQDRIEARVAKSERTLSI
jgi:polar amino acid transport system permease protein